MDEVKQSSQGDPYGDIWLTSKARMQSHARFELYNLVSYIVLTAYSVLLLAFSIFENHLTSTPIGPYTSEISIALSVSVLCASLIIWGLKFDKTANKHRQCYIALQKLYHDTQDRNNKQAYYEILNEYPNHSIFDYEKMLYTNIWCQAKELKNKQATIKFGWKQFWLFWSNRLLRLVIGTLVVLLPLLIMATFYVTS